MPNTREKLLDMSRLLRYCAVEDDCINCERWDVDCGSRKCLDDLLLKAAELLESVANGVTVQQWISVKDRLPEQGQEVIVYSGGVLKPTVFAYQFWNKHYDSWARITHWMPLPKPPKEGEG